MPKPTNEPFSARDNAPQYVWLVRVLVIAYLIGAGILLGLVRWVMG